MMVTIVRMMTVAPSNDPITMATSGCSSVTKKRITMDWDYNNKCFKARELLQLLSFICSFDIMFLYWKFTICQFVFSYFIKLGTMFTIWKIPPATRSNGKQNIQFQNKSANNAKVSRVNRNTLCCLTFPRSRQQTSHYKLLFSQFWAEELGSSFLWQKL